MEKLNININSTPKKLRVLNYEESQEVLGVFLNQDLQDKYKTLKSRSELRGITMEPIIKQSFIDDKLLQQLEEQCKLFKSVFNSFKEIHESLRTVMSNKSFSTPYYIDDIKCPTDEYCLVFNDSPENPYNSLQYPDFINIYDYPSLIFKVNESFLRANIAKMINIELLKAEGLIRNEDNTYQKLLSLALDGNLENQYFALAAESYKNYLCVKKQLDTQKYTDEKLSLYETEYIIIKNQRFKGVYFHRDDFTIDRLIISDKGVFVCTLDKNNLEINSADCVAIKQILRNEFKDIQIPIFSVVLLCNEKKEDAYDTNLYNVIQVEDIYAFIESKQTPSAKLDTADICDTILKYEIQAIKQDFHFYKQELESVNVIYEQIYYEHIYNLSQVVNLLWKLKKEDYYETKIRQKKILTACFSLAAVFSFDYMLYASLTGFNYLFLTFCMLLTFVFIGAAYYEFDNLNSWKKGKNDGECYKVNRKYFVLGFIPTIFVSFILSIAVKLLLNFLF